MKRYGLSMAFVLLIVISIGTFYMQAANVQHPDFRLITQQGDESEVDGMSLCGNYSYLEYRLNESVIVDTSGSEYMVSRPSLSFFLNSPTYWYNADVKQLISEHRQFMRGKPDANAFYEDDQLLAYVEVKSDDPFSSAARKFYFEVSVLDKMQNKNWSYKVNVPNNQLEYQIYVQDVQVFEDEIVVLTTNSMNTIGSQFHRYSLDLKSNRVPQDQLIVLPKPESVEIEGSGAVVHSDINSVFGASITKPSRYGVYYATQTRTVLEGETAYTTTLLEGNGIQLASQIIDEGSRQEIRGAQLIVYDLETGLEMKIDSELLSDFIINPSELKFMNMKLDGEILFLTKQSEQGVAVMEYHITDGEVTIHDIHLENPITSVIINEIKDDRLYLLTEGVKEKSQPSIFVVDLNSDETIYQGKIGLKQSGRDEAEELEKLSVYTMEIQ